MRKWISIGTLVAVAIAIAVLRFDTSKEQPKPTLPEPVSYQDMVNGNTNVASLSVNENTNSTIVLKQPTVTSTPATKPIAEKPATDTAPTIVAPINLAVPFQPQAPFGIWGLLYKEACEEASVIMVDYYLKGRSSMTAAAMDTEILALTTWEAGHRYAVDVSTVDLKKIAEEYYGYTAQVIDNLTVQTIMEQLKLGRPVIIPAAGQELGNPYFTQPGPPYHMVVIKGIAADGRFITNDPGTKRGADYLYKVDVLLAAVRDWNNSPSGYPEGPHRGLVIYK